MRKLTRQIKVGDVPIGGGSPIVIQSMTNTKTADVKSTVKQIVELQNAGCEIVRMAVPDIESAKAILKIKEQVVTPLIADIHFDHKLALESVKSGVDGLRLNPGNIGSKQKVLEVINAARDRKIPIRIGVNSGSLSKEMLKKYGVSAQGIVESALQHVAILEDANYHEIKISVKSSSVPLTIESYRLLSSKVDYPLHLGVTEAGTDFAGSIKSSVGIGTLLAEGIGDTIRVSLTSNPLNEIAVARQILQALELKKGLEIISCPTCGRTEIDIITLAKQAERRLQEFSELPLKIAVMGCVVNGPGEAREADYGIAGGKKEGLIFKNGEILKKVPEADLIDQLIKLIKTDLK
ncbi:MAG: flavodoxin-dependent (E)-4-hydroxy-3-methylbut-2-enyl-diphosphate synthase [Candidatus Cloacimonetes bacterium]|nr:flavodoxin-dependent (E)-4-hydroxy-3-methylbut-2-enyl-diphosphate synthase [Candidatus Cloacimonadota bacterium]MCF7814320.1 flavodoxin-dependent (E)-4-hydroxy-3-methylbut-2-enyl-diphosphate synthase [Candidatus Cloacimonadota bacterium]MCF7868397.1 flavodoxin-dependent (E)-4-hydroxy-3-methylbut-2-enyl-diphosphate synthase [Candidatus Cloacimonadota bacterium]MCF7883838.1 flavodoxin-dependent (E)-4-hydroxy-3-methylbut-2-enyl-diphosphate synthase [Candidatus Cloacimonadota bacterium]